MVMNVITNNESSFVIQLDEEGVLKIRRILKAKGIDNRSKLFVELIEGGVDLLYDIWCGDNVSKEIKSDEEAG
jgi:hypothetical protein